MATTTNWPTSVSANRCQGMPVSRKGFAPECRRPNCGLSRRRRAQQVGQVSQKDAIRWFQFDQQLQPGLRSGRGAWLGTGDAGRKGHSWHAAHAVHGRPVVFALEAAAPTHLVVAAVGSSQRPEKLVHADTRHKPSLGRHTSRSNYHLGVGRDWLGDFSARGTNYSLSTRRRLTGRNNMGGHCFDTAQGRPVRRHSSCG